MTGPTGSGKSTTLATMIDKINRERAEHIVTIEDPIEFVHQHKKCVVNQRELFADTRSFKSALKSVLRQDPDKVLIGEMRDLETIEAALTIAETGHLTFGTLHTNSAVQTINRIIDVFPPHQQPQIRAQLSFTLEAVLCQMLLPRANGQGRVMVLEIMIPNAAIRNLIREDKLHQIYGMMQAGKERSGMQTMNESLLQHYLRRSITADQALGASTMPEELSQMIQRAQGTSAATLTGGRAYGGLRLSPGEPGPGRPSPARWKRPTARPWWPDSARSRSSPRPCAPSPGTSRFPASATRCRRRTSWSSPGSSPP